MAHWQPVDQVQDLVNKMGGEKGITRFLSGDLVLTRRDPQALLVPVGDPVTLPAVQRFVAKEQFTEANGIAWMSDNFKAYILPVVEENVPETTVTVHELKRDAKDARIYTTLNVDETDELALAHFLEAIQRRLDTWLAGFVVGSDGETWAVDACLHGVGWSVGASRLGYRIGWSAGRRFLSR